MDFNISSKEDINKIKKFVKDFGGLELRDQYCHLHENLMTFYIGHNYWYTNVTIVLDSQLEKEMFISFDIDTFSKGLLKFPEVASIKLDYTTAKITIYGETKKNRISMKFKEESEFSKNDVLTRSQHFLESKIKEPTVVKLSDETFNKLNKIERIGYASTVDLGTIRITRHDISYANKAFIYKCKNEEPAIEEDNPIYLNVSTIPILKAARSFGAGTFKFARTNKFVACEALNFDLIASQKKLNFAYPEDNEIACFAPKAKEGWWLKFNTEELAEVFKEFKNIFTENGWRWEPLTFTVTKGSKTLNISYKDIKVAEERDYEPLEVNTDMDFDLDGEAIKENDFTVSTQLIGIFFNDAKEAVLTFIPKDSKTRQPGSMGVVLSLSENEQAIFTKLRTY